MARQTREEKAAERAAVARTQKITEFKQRVAKARALKVYDEKEVWRSADVSDSGTMMLFEMVRRFAQLSEQLRAKTASLVEQLQSALKRIDENDDDPFRYSNPLATPGSDIEALHHTRKALRESISTLAYVLGYYVPQIQNARAVEQRRRLFGIDVMCGPTKDVADAALRLNSDKPAGEVMAQLQGWYVILEGQAVKNDRDVLVSYDSEEAAWLAAVDYADQYRY